MTEPPITQHRRFRPTRTSLTMYVPFAVLLLLQGALVVFGPSSRDVSTSFGGGALGGEASAQVGADGTAIGAGRGGSSTGGGRTGASTSAGQSGIGPTSAGYTGDTSHCTADGRQHGVVYYAPPCVPRWAGPHTGRTSPRIRDDGTILGVMMLSRPNPALQAMGGGDDPRNTAQNAQEYAKVIADFINRRFELYGRKLQIEVVETNCPTTPQDPPACKQAAQEIAAKGPFFADFIADLYPDLWDIWVREGIMATGGSAIDDPYYTKRRPYRWTEATTGGDIVRMAGNFMCSQMVGRKATHSGQVIHPEIGVRGEVDRKYGILVTAGREPLADGIEAALIRCGVPRTQILKVKPEGDITRAAQESRVVVAKFIEEKVTTVVWANNALAPVIGTPECTRNNYFPEHVVLGSTGIDSDNFGQLYDRAQWAHAFGPSTGPPDLPAGQEDASVVWRAMGRDGSACGPLCVNVWEVANLWGHMIQAAGPDLTPANVERGMLAMAPRGGWEATRDPARPLWQFGTGDYAALSDFRIVWWNPNKVSQANGRPGSYEPVEGGRRWRFDGPLSRALQFPPAPQ